MTERTNEQMSETGVAVPVSTSLGRARGQPCLPSAAATEALGWESGGHPPATADAPGGWGVGWPVPSPDRVAEGGLWPWGAALGQLVQAVLQPEPEQGHLLLQLADGLAGSGGKQQRGTDAGEGSPATRGLPDGAALSFLGGTGLNSAAI